MYAASLLQVGWRGAESLCLLLKFTIGIRIPEDMEKEGIDVSEHAAKSYVH